MEKGGTTDDEAVKSARTEAVSLLGSTTPPAQEKRDPMAADESRGCEDRRLKMWQRWMERWMPTVYYSVIVLSIAAPLVAMVVLFASTVTKQGRLNTFAGTEIGGRLTQAQAKGIDVLCGGLLAPALMALLNFAWFSSTRVSVVNEQIATTGVPLATLVRASTTSSGSFDFFTINSLIQGRTWKLFLLALLVLLSAIARTAITNIIAYEAYDEMIATNGNMLRFLRDPVVDKEQKSTGPWLFGYSKSQQADASNQITALLNGLSWDSASSKLQNGSAYIGINATAASMDNLSVDVVTLYDVPGFRLTIDCAPSLPANFTVLEDDSTENNGYGATTNISALWTPESPSSSPGTAMTGRYQGIVEEIQKLLASYDFVAFSADATQATIGMMTPGANGTDRASSAFGALDPSVIDMAAQGFKEKSGTITVWSLACAITRRDGLLNFTRDDGNWAISAMNFTAAAADDDAPSSPSSPAQRRVASLLADWQPALSFRASGTSVPGMGPALTAYTGALHSGRQFPNFTDFALNYLWATGEAQRIVYEVAASSDAPSSDTNTSSPSHKYYYAVRGTTSEEKYRMTYVPLILLAGLCSLLAAGAVTAALALTAARTLSAATFRQVDVLRLLVDSVAGLREDGREIDRVARGSSNAAIERWAEGYRVAYQKVVDEDGSTRVRLFPSSPSAGMGAAVVDGSGMVRRRLLPSSSVVERALGVLS